MTGAENCPTLHAVHSVLPRAALVPVKHDVQPTAVDCWVPKGHLTHALEATNAIDPGAQSSHELTDDATAALNRPPAQLVQAARPGCSYLPAGQSVHVADLITENLPGAHVLQLVL